MRRNQPEEALNSSRKYSMKAAKELGYGDSVILKLKSAKDISEINRIMDLARHNHFGI